MPYGATSRRATTVCDILLRQEKIKVNTLIFDWLRLPDDVEENQFVGKLKFHIFSLFILISNSNMTNTLFLAAEYVRHTISIETHWQTVWDTCGCIKAVCDSWIWDDGKQYLRGGGKLPGIVGGGWVAAKWDKNMEKLKS